MALALPGKWGKLGKPVDFGTFCGKGTGLGTE